MGAAIDLNCDLGEDPAASVRDEALAEQVSSLNIACGGHAGDEETMARLVGTAVRLGRAIGAHPGYPDRASFGRVEMVMTARQVRESVAAQVGALAGIAMAGGGRIVHVKPHGALYHIAMRRPDMAEAIALGVRDAGLPEKTFLVGLAGEPALALWAAMGWSVAAEGFADRRYESDGSLRARGKAGALLEGPGEAAAQALRLARGEGVIAPEGAVVPLRVDTICIHSDTPGALGTATSVRTALARAGYSVRPLGMS